MADNLVTGSIPATLAYCNDDHGRVQFNLQVGTVPHTPHYLVMESRVLQEHPGCSLVLKQALFHNEAIFNEKPSQLMDRACVAGARLITKETRRIVRLQEHERNKTREIRRAATWGAMYTALQSYERDRITNFDHHSVFLLGVDFDPDTNRLVAILSTENLLLNAYRQRHWGFPIFFNGDSSWRYTKERIGLYPILTTNIGQNGKTIAYALISHETREVKEFIFRIVREGVERIVNELIESGNAIM
jgi:hypothetical protein